MSNNYIPAGYHAVTPSLVCRDAAAAIEFYQRAFGATVRHRMQMPDGKVMHAELQIGDSAVMLSDEFPDFGSVSPKTLGGTATTLHVYVPDVDAAFKQAIEAGATEQMPVQNQFWGDRSGYLHDPFGHRWGLATRVEEVSPEETDRRGQQWARDASA
jgi:uncharacterized glyoxalase superfamily protein PhnB